MRAALATGLTLVLAVAVFLAARPSEQSAAADSTEPQVAHMVYFSLKDNSPANKKKLVDACKKYLSKHPGTVYFSAGTRAEDFKRDVNDVDFDVALNLVFKNKAAHEKYQDAEMHKQFITENKDNWKKVRVFDSYLEP